MTTTFIFFLIWIDQGNSTVQLLLQMAAQCQKEWIRRVPCLARVNLVFNNNNLILYRVLNDAGHRNQSDEPRGMEKKKKQIIPKCVDFEGDQQYYVLNSFVPSA